LSGPLLEQRAIENINPVVLQLGVLLVRKVTNADIRVNSPSAQELLV
jgi:hypothetical protein